MLTLTYIKLILLDLLDRRRADLLLSKSGNFHLSDLEEHSDAIVGLPPALTGGTPLAAEIDALDAKHDGYGGVIYFTVEAALRHPDATPALVEAATRVRLAFIPSLDQLKAPYAIEAERAIERRPLLVSMKDDLMLFPVAGGDTLHGVATRFLIAGEEIHNKLSERADVTKASRKAAVTLRPSAIGLLNRLRADLTREIKKDASLPRDLEQRVFGYMDQLVRMYEKPVSAAPEAAPAPAPEAAAAPKAEPVPSPKVEPAPSPKVEPAPSPKVEPS